MISEKTLIIAEAGVNHNGSVELARKLIDIAADSGVDIIKFQTFKTELLVTKDAKKAEYQFQNIQDADQSQFNMLKKLELDVKTHSILIDYCLRRKIEFLSTAFDLESIELLNNLGINTFKIPSGEITNLPYLKRIGKLGKNIIISTGMADLGEVEDAIDVLLSAGTIRDNITVLHCNTEYPTPMEDVNLKAMLTIKDAFKVKVGYSDHTLGIEVPIAAVALGASCIEKHFTLDRNLPGPDHKASLEPEELKLMVKSIRNIEISLGNGIKKPSLSEQKNLNIARKSIHISQNLPKGHLLAEEDLVMKRPGNGISPMLINHVVGKKLNVDLVKDHQLSFEDII